jgi:5-methylcytosine-specific restriction endonuclease McrBC regulatory subunit McrC
LKPDIWLKKKDNSKNIIIDTKWKQAKNEKDLPSNGDLQQLFAYAMYWNCEKVALLYPGESSKNVKDYTKLIDNEYRFLFNKEPKILCNLLFAGGGEIKINDKNERKEMQKIQVDICEAVNEFLK